VIIKTATIYGIYKYSLEAALRFEVIHETSGLAALGLAMLDWETSHVIIQLHRLKGSYSFLVLQE